MVPGTDVQCTISVSYNGGDGVVNVKTRLKGLGGISLRKRISSCKICERQRNYLILLKRNPVMEIQLTVCGQALIMLLRLKLDIIPPPPHPNHLFQEWISA